MVAYIFFTCIVVSTWSRYFVTKLGTLVFYAVMGMLFWPAVDNLYLKVRGDNIVGREIKFVTTS
ncbi:hypothetical protein ACHAWF_003657 [Thalassiosira exigua]